MTSRREWHAQTVPARVLVVDDEPSITDAVATALRYEGFETSEVGDRPRGRCGAAEEFAPDLVVLDVMLPDLDGFAIARRLRARRTRVPVIFLTARDATEDKVAGLTLGATTTSPSRSASTSSSRACTPCCAARAATPARSAALRRPRARRGRPTRCAAPASADRADADRVRAAALPDAEPAPRAVEARRSSTTCGSTTSAATRTSSRRTFATCARSSTGTARR